MHASGNGLERDYGMAFSLLRKAADAGSALAEVGIASLYSFGLGAERNPEAALASYLRAAERGSAEACVRLGVIYATGDGVEQDYAKAAEWYAKAELQGDADGKTNLAFLYIRGLGVSLDQARGIRMLGELSEAGSLSTVWSLYHLHDSGTYVPADPAEARRWLERAADMGSGVAACEFARQVEYAIRGAPAFDRVLAWLLAAAEREDAAAQEVLGRWYYEGKLVPRDEATALRWNSLAAEGGNPFAQAWLGDVLNQGLAGVIVDHAAARRWYEKAAIQRHVGALTLLTHMVFSEAADDEALRNLFSLWLNIAQAGDGGAQLQVAGFYLEGTGTEPSIAEAVKWLKAAAEGGNADAQVRLGGLLLQSKEAAGDPMQAAALFQQAATRGNVDGEYNLGVCYRLGLGVPVDRDRARSLYFGAAIKGHRSAQLALGDLLVEIGDENTLKEAVKWYEEAAAVGIPEALFGLAHLYETGKGVYPDRERAVQLNRRAAESGHAGAEAALARLAGVQSAA
jgi:TPR repeat protein